MQPAPLPAEALVRLDVATLDGPTVAIVGPFLLVTPEATKEDVAAALLARANRRNSSVALSA